MNEASKGDIWLTNLPGGSGHEQKGRKYAVVLRDVGKMNIVVLVPLTSKSKTEHYPFTHLIVPSAENGLVKETYAIVFQIVALDKSRLVQKTGHLAEKDVSHINLILKDMLKL